MIELNFLGLDPSIVDPMDSYEKPDDRLPLMVFGPLSLLSEGPSLEIDGLHIPMPRPSGLAVEKLIDDRGAGLEPPRRIVWISRAQAAGLQGAPELVLRLDAEMLAAQDLALLAFDAV